MTSLSINGYNSVEWSQSFPNTWMHSKLLEVLGDDVYITYEPFDSHRVCEQWTPREAKLKKIFHANTFFYLEKLFEQSPVNALDVGCGQNLWKQFWSQITGIDADPRQSHADYHDFFDKDFSDSNFQKFDCAMAINSLHFVSLDMLSANFERFCNILMPGGHGYITFCSGILRQNTDGNTFKDIFGSSNPNQTLLSFYLHNMIKKSGVEIITLDNFMEQCNQDSIDGNFRVLFKLQ
jgi:hypothetical protein